MDIEQLNEISVRVGNIQENDEIPIGGSFAGKLDLHVTADLVKFQDFFESVDKNVENLRQNESFQKWVKNTVPDFDAEILTRLLTFDNVLRQKYPQFQANVSERQKFYDKAQSKPLSQAFEKGVCQCAEIAILAQAYCERAGLQTKYFGGEVLFSKDEEFGNAHSFLTLETDKGSYIYDPANAIQSTSGLYYPKIAIQEVTPAQKRQFENKIHRPSGRNCAFLETTDILTKTKWYYGCGDGANIFPSFIISKNRPPIQPEKGNSLC